MSATEGNDAFLNTVTLVFFVILFLIQALEIAIACICLSWSVKKRVLKGEDYTAGQLFLWYFGYYALGSFTCGLGLPLFYLRNRKEVLRIKEQYKKFMRNVQIANAQGGGYNPYEADTVIRTQLPSNPYDIPVARPDNPINNIPTDVTQTSQQTDETTNINGENNSSADHQQPGSIS